MSSLSQYIVNLQSSQLLHHCHHLYHLYTHARSQWRIINYIYMLLHTINYLIICVPLHYHQSYIPHSLSIQLIPTPRSSSIPKTDTQTTPQPPAPLPLPPGSQPPAHVRTSRHIFHISSHSATSPYTRHSLSAA